MQKPLSILRGKLTDVLIYNVYTSEGSIDYHIGYANTLLSGAGYSGNQLWSSTAPKQTILKELETYKKPS